jgi:hypothetical protein
MALASLLWNSQRNPGTEFIRLRASSLLARERLRTTPTEAALFINVSKVDHAATTERGHTRIMAPKSKMLTGEEFASLLTVGNTCAVLAPPAVIPAKHRARLIELGYMVHLSGRLRMTTPGRARIAAETYAPLKRGHSGGRNSPFNQPVA